MIERRCQLQPLLSNFRLVLNLSLNYGAAACFLF
jgi:hypothetical protein